MAIPPRRTPRDRVFNAGGGPPAGGGGGSYTDPLTTDGDILIRDTTTKRLAKGSDGQVLTLAAGLPSWAAAGGGYTDPLTTDGDILIRDTTTKRLAKGTDGQFLQLSGGLPVWGAAGAGYTDPLTTDGDILIRDTTTKRLAKGTDGQVLTLASGLPSWAAAAGGGGSYSFYDPDMIPGSVETEDDEFDGGSLDAKWTWKDQNSATATVAGTHLLLGTGGVSAAANRRLVQTIPAGTQWRCRCKVSIADHGSSPNQSTYGLIVADGNLKMVSIGPGYVSGYRITTFLWNSSGSWAGTADQTVSSDEAHVGRPVYLEIARDGNDLHYSVSYDGLGWTQVYSHTSFMATAASEFGIQVYRDSSAVTQNANFDWFRYKGDLTTEINGGIRTVSTP